ncbi:hypothetical protein F0562_015514 [Nyssa sinensis]|uniref:Uncharacterized protein n=1 Tax=Nyssa sinensis TaxID=561372 RepID=A0A5J4ZKG9_9ASTE|nr:hypothetical protein F0562_015514 [Nyssa sinensis]
MGVKGDFMVKVMRNERVAAVLPMQENWLPLSNLDFILPPVDMSVFFCYKKPTGGENLFTFGSMVSVLKKALAQTLVSYYAFAGELVQNSVGEVELLCNNHGVEFLEAFADLELRHLNLHNPDESVEGKLVPKNQGVLSVQVTEVKCGGLVVGCTFDHRVADAYSANMFLVSWAEMAQSKPLSQQPSFRRSLLDPRHPGHYDPSLDDMYVSFSALKPPKDPRPSVSNDPLISRIYYIEAKQLSWLESLASDNGCKRTKLEAFSAFLWKMVAAGEDGSGKICRMGIVVDGRKRISEGDSEKTAMMAAYFGNVVSIPFGEKNIGELKEKPVSWVADAIHECLETAVTKEHFLGLIDWVEAHHAEPALAKIYADSGNEDDGTKLEAFSAFLWKMVAAGEDGSGKICRMGIVVDGRKRISEGDSEKTAMMAAYFGNVVSIPFGEKNIGELKEKPVSWVADAIHECLETAVTKEHFLGLIDWVEAHRAEPALAKIYADSGNEDDGSALVVSSGQRFLVSKVDFGWGKPAFGSYHFPWDGEAGYVMPMPSPLGNGDWVVYMHLFKWQFEMIEMQAAHLLRPLTCDYLKF